MVKIRQAAEADEKAIRDLFRICFGKDLSPEEWRWKYQKSYLGSSSFVAEDNGVIVAHYGGFRLNFHSNGTLLNAYQGCDVMTHPQYRARLFSRRGIIVKTAEAFYAANPDMEFIYGFPSERHGKLKALQLGFEKHNYITIMKKERSFFSPQRYVLLRVESGWDRIRPGEIDGIWTAMKDTLPLSIEKMSGYIFWRYRDKPNSGYEFLAVRSLVKRDMKAYCIVKVVNNVLQVLDFFVLPSVDCQKFLSVLEKFALMREIRHITFWVNPAEKFFQELKVKGYSEDRDIPYIVKVFKSSRISPKFFLDNYCYRHGDYDAT